MARKAVERNISYDDVRQLYYVSMELGRDENGKRIKQYRTFPTLTAARNGLRDFHTQRERQDMLLASPMDRVEPPRSRVKEAFFYDNEELKQLYQLIEGHILELAVKMAGSLGMRREEICGLKWENVDFRRRLVLVREARTAYGATIVQKETKNRASVRTLYLPEEVLLLLGREQERQEEERARQGAVFNRTDHVILDHKGAPYSPNALSLAFTRFVRKNGLPRLTFHGLRHTFATIASCQGASLFDIGKALGHSPPPPRGGSIPIWWTAPTRTWCSGCPTP